MTPSNDSLRLRALALEALPLVAKKNDCVAVTGAAARGTATRDSTLELWVLGQRRGRASRTVGGSTISLRFQRPDESRRFESLSVAEVDDLLVLDDRAGHFEALRTTWRKHRRRVRAELIRDAQRRVEQDLSQGQRGSDWHRATHLRLAVWRLLGLRVFIDHGWHVPQLGALRGALSGPLARRLDDALALPRPAACGQAVKLLPAALREARRLDEHGTLDGYVLPSELAARVKVAPAEVGFLARHELTTRLLPAIFGPWGITDVRGVELLSKVAPSAVKAFLLLEPRPRAGAVKKLLAHVAAIQRAP